MVFDTGGGSSQFTFGHGAEVDDRFSVDVGAVRYTERFGLDTAVSTETLHAAIDAIASDLHRLEGRPAPDALVGMGGAMTNITAVKLGLDRYDPDAVQGAILDASRHRSARSRCTGPATSTPVARSSGSSPSGPT